MEMAIEESMHLQEREVIRGGWYTAVDIQQKFDITI
jgi:hypothetical protein